MEMPKRMSLNTSLKNAKIFEDDSEDSTGPYITFEEIIKQKQKEAETQDIKIEIKKEKIDEDYEPKFKLDSDSSSQGSLFPDGMIKPENIKAEPEYNSSDNCDIAMGRLGLQTPIKTETNDEGLNRSNLKSAKRTLLKQRNSPYSKNTSSSNDDKKTMKRELSKNGWELVESKVRKTNNDNKSEKKFETDPAVLERRQKQIDFGKNTVGYDNYIRQVPKEKRTPEDPVTPNKYRVYSRRGFDGLIKQWRLKLHNYDP